MPTIHELNIFDLIEIGFHNRASDVLIKAESPVFMRQFSIFQPLSSDIVEVLTNDDVIRLLSDVMSDKQRRKFEDTMEMDLAFAVKGKCRVRCNIYMQRGTWAAVMRIIPLEILTLEELGMPPVLAEFTKHRLGLCLVTGPTGSGKTTTLAAMIDLINIERKCHIVTIEDPLE